MQDISSLFLGETVGNIVKRNRADNTRFLLISKMIKLAIMFRRQRLQDEEKRVGVLWARFHVGRGMCHNSDINICV